MTSRNFKLDTSLCCRDEKYFDTLNHVGMDDKSNRQMDRETEWPLAMVHFIVTRHALKTKESNTRSSAFGDKM